MRYYVPVRHCIKGNEATTRSFPDHVIAIVTTCCFICISQHQDTCLYKTKRVPPKQSLWRVSSAKAKNIITFRQDEYFQHKAGC